MNQISLYIVCGLEPKLICADTPSKRKLSNESSQAKVHKRMFPSEISQAKDPKRKWSSERNDFRSGSFANLRFTSYELMGLGWDFKELDCKELEQVNAHVAPKKEPKMTTEMTSKWSKNEHGNSSKTSPKMTPKPVPKWHQNQSQNESQNQPKNKPPEFFRIFQTENCGFSVLFPF